MSLDLYAIKERNQSRLNNSIVLFREDVETTLQLIEVIEQLQKENAELTELVNNSSNRT